MKKKIIIHHISDTHGFHQQLIIPEKVNIIIHSGDCSNYRNPMMNANEVLDFIEWYKDVPIKHKIYVAGNHCTSIETGLITKKNFTDAGIHYLENESIIIRKLKIWGSPLTPAFLNWAFNIKRNQLHDVWAQIPDDTDIVITHGPPKGILDLAYDNNKQLEFCGCNALMKRMKIIQPQLCLFGHIHNNNGIINAGYKKLSNYPTIFSNGSVVTDGKFGILSSQGNTFFL